MHSAQCTVFGRDDEPPRYPAAFFSQLSGFLPSSDLPPGDSSHVAESEPICNNQSCREGRLPFATAGRGAVWLARLNGVQKVASSNLVAPTFLRKKPFGENVEGLSHCGSRSCG